MSLQQQHSSTGSHHKHRAPPPNSTPASTAGANNSSSSAQQQETVVDPVETQLNRLLAITDDDDDGPSQQQQQRQTQQTQTETQQPQQQQQQQQQQQRSRRNQQNRRQYHNDGGVHHHHGGMNNIAAMYESGDIIPNTGVDSGGVGSSRRQYASTLKVLLSNNLAGSIIGRNGQSISDLQARSGCRIKLSQSGDTFPGTGERVCLIQGEGVNAVREAVALVLAKVRDAKSSYYSQEGQGEFAEDGTDSADVSSRQQRTRSSTYVIKVLVPSPACGMLIGRGGSNIKSISESSGARIQLASKDEAASVATSERVVTITGDLGCCTSCIGLVLDSLHENPELARYANMTTSYSRAMASSAMGGGGGGVHQGHGAPVGGSYLQQQQGHSGNGGRGHGGGGDIAGQGGGGSTWSPFQGGSIVQGDTILQSGGGGANASVNGQPSGGNLFLSNGAGGEHSGGTDRQPEDNSGSGHGNSASHTIKLAIPDGAIGALVGRGGSNISELQHYTGARIHVSQKGMYMPGTTDRIVTISGLSKACSQAQYLIHQKVLAHQQQQASGEGGNGGGRRDRSVSNASAGGNRD